MKALTVGKLRLRKGDRIHWHPNPLVGKHRRASIVDLNEKPAAVKIICVVRCKWIPAEWVKEVLSK